VSVIPGLGQNLCAIRQKKVPKIKISNDSLLAKTVHIESGIENKLKSKTNTFDEFVKSQNPTSKQKDPNSPE